jgi:hypothetical protein
LLQENDSAQPRPKSEDRETHDFQEKPQKTHFQIPHRPNFQAQKLCMVPKKPTSSLLDQKNRKRIAIRETALLLGV